jgi:tetratricopeptide (TPR) repeat protein
VERKPSEQARGRHSYAARKLQLSRSELALSLGEHQQAVHLADLLLADDSSFLPALEIKAKALWKAGRHQDLVPTLDTLIRLHPYEPGYHALKGAALQALGRYREAKTSLIRGQGLPGTSEALQDLELWQVRLVSELLDTDPVFRASFMQNPQDACAKRGFEYLPDGAVEGWNPSSTESAFSYPRPS